LVDWRIDMAITPEEIAREKKRLPRGWGRVGKSLDRLEGISEPGETLLSSCVGLNPSLHQAPVLPVIDNVPVGSIVGGIIALTQSTNIVFAVTTERLVMVGTGLGGAPTGHGWLPLEGLEIASSAKTKFVVRFPEGELRVTGAAKQQLPEFLSALAEQIRRRTE
jgi:hypothetical protein